MRRAAIPQLALPPVTLPEDKKKFIATMAKILSKFTAHELVTIFLTCGAGGLPTKLKDFPAGSAIPRRRLKNGVSGIFSGRKTGDRPAPNFRNGRTATGGIFPAIYQQAMNADLAIIRRDSFLHVVCVCVLVAIVADSGIMRDLYNGWELSQRISLTSIFATLAASAICLLGFLAPRRFIYLMYRRFSARSSREPIN